MKLKILCSISGVFGSVIAYLFGGWDWSIQTLILFMAIDYISGLAVAGIFHKSNKTESGALESKSCWKGLMRKGMTLFVVIVMHRIDLLTGGNLFRDGVCIAFIVNEFISITENAGLMGLNLPPIVKNAIDILKDKGVNNE